MNMPANDPAIGVRKYSAAPVCPPHALTSRQVVQSGRDTLPRVPNVLGLRISPPLGVAKAQGIGKVRDTRERVPTTGERAFTRLELLVVLGAVALLAVVATPLLGNTVLRSQRAVCANNLRQISVGFRAYAMHNQGKYPWIVNTNYSLVPIILTAQAELGTTRILICPSDGSRLMADSFTNFVGTSRLSYFINTAAQEHQSSTWLAGDRNISVAGVLNSNSASTCSWQAGQAGGLHETEGNIVMADGQTRQLSTAAMRTSALNVLSNKYSLSIAKP